MNSILPSPVVDRTGDESKLIMQNGWSPRVYCLKSRCSINHWIHLRQAVLQNILAHGFGTKGFDRKKITSCNLNYSSEENLLVKDVIHKLIESRLIVQDANTIEPSY